MQITAAYLTYSLQIWLLKYTGFFKIFFKIFLNRTTSLLKYPQAFRGNVVRKNEGGN